MTHQHVGVAVDTAPAERPQRVALSGRYVEVLPLDAGAHVEELFAAASSADSSSHWTYLSFGPWTNRAAFATWLEAFQASRDPFPFTLRDTASGKALGMASYMRIEPQHRVIEIGSIWYAPTLQRSRAATEAMYLLARHAFETLRYRRYEWKCNSHNEPSRRAALRLGFTYEGLFRQHMISRGRNRDTAWFSMLDTEWPERKQAFERWLAADNFDAAGRQNRSLADLRAEPTGR